MQNTVVVTKFGSFLWIQYFIVILSMCMVFQTPLVLHNNNSYLPVKLEFILLFSYFINMHDEPKYLMVLYLGFFL